MATVMELKNKESIVKLWNSLKEEIEKGTLYSDKWFKSADLEELQDVRKNIHQDYLNPELDMDYRDKCGKLLARFDSIISKRKRYGKEYVYPAHSERG